MNRPVVTIELARTDCEPGGMISGRYLIDPESVPLAARVEVSVYWITEGKGDEDRAAQYRRSGLIEEGTLFNERGAGRFAIGLPTTPLSYEGVLVKIVWYVQVRITFAGGAESEAAVPFRLGRVGPVTEVTDA